jgi:hypothetical protein
MSEGELPERPGSALTTEQHGLSRERDRRNPFAAEIRGEKPPYSYEVFDRVLDKLGNMMDDYPWKNWVYTELHEDDKAEAQMIFRGFQTVAYDHLGGTEKAILQDKLYEAATTTDPDTLHEFTPADFAENQRIYNDRFELTYRQARAVQKIMRYVGEDYNPGGAEPTPENLAKRTFYYDDYLGRPIPKDHPEATLAAKPTYEREIAEYVKAKNPNPPTPVKP